MGPSAAVASAAMRAISACVGDIARERRHLIEALDFVDTPGGGGDLARPGLARRCATPAPMPPELAPVTRHVLPLKLRIPCGR